MESGTAKSETAERPKTAEKESKKGGKEKKDAKEKKGNKEKKGKKGKKVTQNQTEDKANKKHTEDKANRKKTQKKAKKVEGGRCSKLPPPVYNIEADLDDCEPFVHNDLHVKVVRQACDEWRAKALVVWTLGSGTGVLAGILQEIPTVGLALTDTHLELASHVIDSEIANRIQLDVKGNKLYDADLHRRAQRALGGGESDDDGEKDKKEKKDSKEKAQEKGNDKGKKDTVDQGKSDDSDDADEDSDSDSSAA